MTQTIAQPTSVKHRPILCDNCLEPIFVDVFRRGDGRVRLFWNHVAPEGEHSYQSCSINSPEWRSRPYGNLLASHPSGLTAQEWNER